MAIVKPFKGIRPPKELVEQVESRPYDVLDSEEARAEAGDNEKSLYHIIKPEIDFPAGTSEYDPRVYEKAAENFQKFQDKGWLVQDKEEHYYIYAQTMFPSCEASGGVTKTQYGLVIGAYVDDYMNGTIKKHELTRRDKEEDRMKHVRVNDANIEPVFFAYPDNAVLDRLIMRYAVTEPEGLWEGIEQGMDGKRRRSLLPVWLFTGVAAAAAVALVLFIRPSGGETPMTEGPLASVTAADTISYPIQPEQEEMAVSAHRCAEPPDPAGGCARSTSLCVSGPRRDTFLRTILGCRARARVNRNRWDQSGRCFRTIRA